MAAQLSPHELTPVLVQHRRMLRLALGTTLSFVTAEVLDWELSFLITVLLVQLLAAPGPALGLWQGVVVVLALSLATGAAATVSTLLVDMPALLAIVLGVVLFLAFVLQRSGRSPAWSSTQLNQEQRQHQKKKKKNDVLLPILFRPGQSSRTRSLRVSRPVTCT